MKVTADIFYRYLTWASVFLAVLFVVAFVTVAFCSANYPFNLEWMEGHSIDVIQRIRGGLPVYTAPSLEYVPFIYTPYYFYVSALVSFATGVDFIAGRALSIASILGCGALLFHWIRREGGDWKTALITAGLFFATYRLSGRWFDVARIDSFYTLLLLGGLYVFYFYRGLAQAFLAALLLTAAFFTKQATLIAVLPALVGGLMLDKKHALQTLGMFLLMVFSGIAVANVVSDGWFMFYVFEVPAGHGIERRVWWDFWQIDILRHFALLLAVCALGAIYGHMAQKRALGWYGCLALGILASVFASRLHWGGWHNVLIPMHLLFALLAGRALVALAPMQQIYGLPSQLLVLMQFLSLLYWPGALIPSQESVDKGNHFLEEISRIDGDIFTSEIQFVQSRVGKKSYTYGMAAFDVLRSDLGEKNYIKKQLRQDLLQALSEHRFAAVIAGRLLKLPEKDAYYRFERNIDYPREYVTGALVATSTRLFVPMKTNVPPSIIPELDLNLPFDK